MPGLGHFEPYGAWIICQPRFDSNSILENSPKFTLVFIPRSRQPRIAARIWTSRHISNRRAHWKKSLVSDKPTSSLHQIARLKDNNWDLESNVLCESGHRVHFKLTNEPAGTGPPCSGAGVEPETPLAVSPPHCRSMSETSVTGPLPWILRTMRWGGVL
jgi:hypothetical protein